MALASRLTVATIFLFANAARAESIAVEPAGQPSGSSPSATASPPTLQTGAALRKERTILKVNRADLRFDADKASVGEVMDVATKKPMGLAFAGIAEGSAYWVLGFRDGDVLKSVNGHEMKAVADVKSIAVSARVAKFHDYKVSRANESIEWRVEFETGSLAKAAVEEPAKVVVPERVIKLKKDALKTLDFEPASARLSPEYKEGGSIRCFRVVNVAPTSVFKRAGFVNGDCVLTLNGKKLSTPSSTLEIFDGMRAQAAPLTFEVERRGGTKAFRVEFE